MFSMYDKKKTDINNADVNVSNGIIDMIISIEIVLDL